MLGLIGYKGNKILTNNDPVILSDRIIDFK